MKPRFFIFLRVAFFIAEIFFISNLSAQNTSVSIQTISKEKIVTNYDWVSLMNDTSSNFYDIQASFNAYWEGKTPGKGQGYKPFKRWENFMIPRVYPTGIRPKADIVAQEYDKFEKANPCTSFTKSGTGTWTLVGPNGAPSGSVPNGAYQSPAGAGRVNCIRFNPVRSNSMWIGTPSGGAWKSYDAGSNWIPALDNSLSMGVSDIAIASDTNIIYIATGDADAGDTYSIGILKSTDAGSTWQTTSFTTGVSSGIKIYKLLAHPSNSDIMYIATNAGLYKTTDGMATYSRIGVGTIGTCFDIEFKPGTPSTVYAAGARVWYSTNDGSSWTAGGGTIPTSGYIRVAIAVSAAAPNNVYALLANNTDYGFLGFYTSTNSGSTYSTTYADGVNKNLLGWNTNFSGEGGQGWYDLTLSVSPTNANNMFIGGVNLQKSTNGGTSWVCNAYWLSGAGYQYAHADHHAIEFYPGSGTTVYDGNDGGIFKTTNTGTTWSDLSGTLAIGQLAQIGASEQNVIMSGWQDNGSNIANSGSWSIVYGGDGCEAIVDYSNNNIVYSSYVYGDIRRSPSQGAVGTWSTISTAAARGENGEWITPFVLHPTTNTTIFAGYASLWKSTNSGTAWTKCGTITGGTGSLLRIAVAPSLPTTIYVIKLDKIFKTSNENGASTTWTDITGTLSGYAFSDIVVNANDPNIVWVTVSGYSSGAKVFKSTDGGSTWINYSSNLPNIPFNAIVSDKNNNDDGVYVGADIGVYYRDNLMPNWVLYNSGLPNAVIKELEICYTNNKLRAGTYGRGLWESDLYIRPDIAPVAGINADKTSLNSCTGYVVNFQDASDNVPTSWLWSFPGGSPPSSSLQNPIVTYPSTSGTHSVYLTVTNSKGSDAIAETDFITIGENIAPLEESFTSSTFPSDGWSNTLWTRSTAVGADGNVGGAAYFYCFNYASGTTGNLISTSVDLNGVTTPYLKFNVAYRQYSTENDRLQVWISNNCGSTWTSIYDKQGATLATLAASTANFVPGASNNWRAESVNLASYMNQKVMVKFTGISNYGNNIWIDDIKIGEQTCSVGAAGAISGTQTLCQGTTGVSYSVPVIANATDYVWTLPSGATIVSGDNTRNITVDYADNASSGTISVKGSAACGSGTSSAIAITVNQLPSDALPIVGPDVCALPQTGLVYQIPYITNFTIGQTGYVWSLPSGGTITAGDNTNRITVDFAGGASSGDIIVYGTNGCGNGGSASKRITMGVPSAPGAITGYSSICAGDNEIPYSIDDVPGASSYSWTLPSGASIASGDGSSSITVNYSGSAVSGNISVSAVNACGSSGSSPLFAVTVSNTPAQPSAITGSPSPTQGATETYSVTNVGGVYYTWNFPSDWAITSGQGTNSIDVIVGGSGGNISVTPSSGICVGDLRILSVSPVLLPIYKTKVTGMADWSLDATWLKPLTGTITTVTGGSPTAQRTVTGTGTLFSTEVSPGDVIVISSNCSALPFTVASVTNNTSLLLNGAAGSAYTNVTFGIEKAPSASSVVQIGNENLAGDVTVMVDVTPVTIGSLSFLANNYNNTLSTNGAGSFTVNGSVTINRPSDISKSNTLNMKGTNIVSGNILNSSNINLLSTATLTVNGTTTNSGTFNIKSDVDGTASFIDNGVTGTFIVEKYLTNGRWWYLGSPLSNGSTNAFGTLSASPSTGERLFYWDEPTHGYVNVSTSDLMPGLRGYTFKNYGGAPITATYIGELNSGIIGGTTNLTYNAGTSAGFNLLCNPYPSALNWGSQGSPTTGLTQTNIATSLWYRQDGSFATYNWTTGIGANGGQQYIPAMQAFWVRTLGSSGGLQLTNATRVHNSQAFYKESIKENVFRIELQNAMFSDETVIHFTPGASSEFDNFDSEKMFTDDDNYPQLYTLTSDNTNLAINGEPELDETSERIVPLGFLTNIPGTFILKSTNISEFYPGINVYLEDSQLNYFHNLNTSDSYSFTAGIEDNSSRFKLHFGSILSAMTSDIENSVILYVIDNVIFINTQNNGSLEIYNTIGEKIAQHNINKGANKIPLNSAKGIYLVKVMAGLDVVTKKVFVGN